MTHLLTTDATDQLVLAACTPSDGAIEDCEVHPNEVLYFFETDAVASVDRMTGDVSFTR